MPKRIMRSIVSKKMFRQVTFQMKGHFSLQAAKFPKIKTKAYDGVVENVLHLRFPPFANGKDCYLNFSSRGSCHPCAVLWATGVNKVGRTLCP